MNRLTPFVLTLGFAATLPGPIRARDEGPKSAPAAEAAKDAEDAGKVLLDLSKQKWIWMADKDLDALEGLFHEKSAFTHMSGTWDRARELEIIRSGSIHYKKTDVEESSARVVGATGIVMNKIRLLAVVRGNEVTNPFMVTEVYVREGDDWKLVQLSFSRLLGP